MNTTTFTITGNTQTLSGNIYYDEVTVKGRSDISYDFTQLNTVNNTILRARFDYGDGSEVENINYGISLDHINQPITYYFALYGAYSPLLIKSHIYDPPVGDSYFKSLTASCYIELADTRLLNLYFPIKISQPSYYEEIGDINIGATQLINVSSNDIFCSIYDKTGDVFNIVLS
jgi:hypothetical protein